MDEQPPTTKQEVLTELESFPAQVSQEFDRAWDTISAAFDEDQRIAWALAGLTMARMSVRSWEAAGLYYSVSPNVAGLMPFNYFTRWAEAGFSLCRESPTLASCYFTASPGTMARLRSRHIETWAKLGRDLYKGTWKSSNLACKFFEASPVLLKSVGIQELERFVAFLDALSRRSYDLAMESVSFGQKVFPMLSDDKEAFIDLAMSLVDTNWRQAKSFFESAARSLPKVAPKQRIRFLKLLNQLLDSGATNVPGMMIEVSESLAELDEADHEPVLELAEALIEVSPAAMPELIKSAPRALSRVTMPQLQRWFNDGVALLHQNVDGGMAYFRMESSRSQAVLENLSSSVEFVNIKDLMEMYCQALAGSDVTLSESGELAEKNIGWVSGEAPTTEGTTVFVPSSVDRYGSKHENFSWFKVVSTHQVAHLEFGSFDFVFDRPSALFEDIRETVETERLVQLAQAAAEAKAGAEDALARDGEAEGSDQPDESEDKGAWVTDIQRFFNLFDDRTLALDVFTVVEDGRLDASVKGEYLGIKTAYSSIQMDAVHGRQEISSLPARQALVEYLVRRSLLQIEGLKAPAKYVEEAYRIGAIARRATRLGAIVEDAAEATLRIYAVLSQVPNEEVAPEDWEDMDADDQEYEDEDDSNILEQLMPGVGSEDSGEDDSEYEASQDVDFRGEFKPEMVQLLSELRSQQGEPAGEQGEITQEMIQELLDSSSELDDQEEAEGSAQASTTQMASNLMQEAGMAPPESSQLGQGPLVHVDEEGGSLEPTEPQTFVYDEWDFRAEDYKPRWCIVRQKSMAEGDSQYFGATLHSYSVEVEQIRRQFEQLVPEMFRRVRKLEDGEEIDIDDVIEAIVDIKTGAGPSEKLYWRRNKVQRDVAVVFLLDTSASTAEAIDESRKMADDWEAPDDPVEYMVWLRNRRGEGMRRTYKRIIDLEKEAVVLLINALEAIGDVYGIYAFSGYGRENVEFYNIKDIDESFSDSVKRRIDRISPLHATRMGPAIRHATTKLEAQDAKTKLLFLISDGRPQDRGYSREGVEKEYAVHDTKMALDEAQKQEIKAFCLTVDKNGHDYLKTMMADNMAYEVLDDIHQLPQRLLYLYKRLTM